MPADSGGAGRGRLGIAPGYTNSSPDRRARAPPLTDIFAMPAWLPFANVFSIGDVLIGVGVAATIALAMRRGAAAGGEHAHDHPRHRLGLPEIVLRTAIVYLFLVVVLRLSGKREVGQIRSSS